MASTSADGGDRTVCIIGGGVSGVATAKVMKEYGLTPMLLESSDHVGGLWQFTDEGYGVMAFTHINVSKYNYSFSDFPPPEDVQDYMHNAQMAEYINSYTDANDLRRHIRFNTTAQSVARRPDGRWAVETRSSATGARETVVVDFVAVATGHHAKPNMPKLEGQEGYTGEVLHSVKYKSATSSAAAHRRVLVVGIGNSAVDVACNAADEGQSAVDLSTRSGAWVVPNYLFGSATDLYANRAFLCLPWQLQTSVFEKFVTMVSGHPSKWGLRPTMRALQAQPTVSPTLVHHIQRGNVEVLPDVARLRGAKEVEFKDGTVRSYDTIVMCTGYRIDLPFLGDAEREAVMPDPSTNAVHLYKNVFSPALGPSLAFIGFVQPASGGIISMSETQARWFAEVCVGRVKLPSEAAMEADIKREQRMVRARWGDRARHSIQRDPLVYCDEIAGMFGANPWSRKLLTEGLRPTPRAIAGRLALAWRLLFGSCGTAQYRLFGPGTAASKAKAAEVVRRVPIPPLWRWVGYVVAALVSSVGSYAAMRLLLPLLRALVSAVLRRPR